jgi:7-cyano-7-deazaguanine synthase
MRRRPDTTAVLVSGGLDSAVLLVRLLRSGRRVWPVYCRCGLAWEAAELYWLRRFLRAVRSPRLLPLRVLDIPVRQVYGAHWSLSGRGVPGSRSADAAVYLPGRNVLLLSHVAVAGADRGITRLALGTLRGNPFADASPKFFRAMGRALSLALGRPIRIEAPLVRLRKAALLRSAVGLPLHLTFSCLRPRLPAGRQAAWRPCGRCNKCAERRRAFRAA